MWRWHLRTAIHSGWQLPANMKNIQSPACWKKIVTLPGPMGELLQPSQSSCKLIVDQVVIPSKTSLGSPKCKLSSPPIVCFLHLKWLKGFLHHRGSSLGSSPWFLSRSRTIAARHQSRCRVQEEKARTASNLSFGPTNGPAGWQLIWSTEMSHCHSSVYLGGPGWSWNSSIFYNCRIASPWIKLQELYQAVFWNKHAIEQSLTILVGLHTRLSILL